MPKQKTNTKKQPALKKKQGYSTSEMKEWKWLDYTTYFLLAGLILLVYIIRSNFFETPFERDEGDYFYLGKLILDGKVPYIDFYEQKLPGLFYSYSLIIRLFGYSLRAAHIGFLCINILTIVILYLIGNKLFNKITAIITAFSFAILSLTPQMSGFTTQSEHLVIFFASGGFLALIYALKDQKYWYLYPLAGLLICYSFLIKQSAIFFILAGGITVLIHFLTQKPIQWKILIKSVLLYSAGVFLMYGIIILALYRQNALSEMWYWTIKYAGNYVSAMPLKEGLKHFSNIWKLITADYALFWVLAGLGMIAVLFTKKSRSFKIIIWIIAILSCLTIIPGLYFYGHYFLMLTPILAVLMGISFYSVSDLLKGKINPNYLNLSLLLIFMFIAAGHLKSQEQYYFKPGRTKLLRQVYGMNPFPESKIVGDFIKMHTEKNDLIAVLGSEPEIYVYADRRCASKHHYITFLMGDTIKFPMNKTYQKEFIHDIETKKPKYLIYYKHYVSWLRNPAFERSIDNWFTDFSNKNYKLVGIADMVSPEQTNYIWYDEVGKYKPLGEFLIGVFEINQASANTQLPNQN